MERGKFITVEGIEGVGKSTNIDVLVRRIEAAGHRVLTTREPGGTPLAEDIRDIVQHRGDEPIPEIAELLLIFAARSLNVNNVILPALEAGHGSSVTASRTPAGLTREEAAASPWKLSIASQTGSTGISGPT